MRALAHSLAALVALAGAPVLIGAAAARRELRSGLLERLGLLAAPGAGRIWVHGSSVGEALAALQLFDALRNAGHTVFGSTSTLTGRAILRSSEPELPCALAPLDHLWCVESALVRVEPRLLALVETELWPFWIAAAERRGIPVVVVSGRISDRSYPRYDRLRRLIAPTLRRIDAVGARTEVDAERFLALGVPESRVSITGDLKLELPREKAPLAADLAEALATVPVIVAGSTHPGEEDAARASLHAAEAAGLSAALVVAPRHLSRVAEVERGLRKAGRTVRRRSDLGCVGLAPGEVLLLDTLGELPGVYAAASVAFVGGSLAPVGGHNLIEPILAGCPVVFGPNTSNVREHAELVLASGAGTRIENSAELCGAIVAALRDPVEYRARGVRGRDALASHQGSGRRTAALIEEVLAQHDGPTGSGRGTRESPSATCRPAPTTALEA